MNLSETQFSKARLEMLCDGIFAIAMTLLVLELKVADLPRKAQSARIWHALRELALTQALIAAASHRAGKRVAQTAAAAPAA